jgi:hypothetical protein
MSAVTRVLASYHLALLRAKGFGQRKPRRRRLILDGLVFRRRPRLRAGYGGVCTLYLVFKEPRHPSAVADCPAFPTTFAFDSAVSFRGTLRDYRAFCRCVNPLFVAEPVLENRLLSSLRAVVAASAFDRRRRVKRV